MQTRTNARGIQTVYSYDLNGNLTGIDYSDDTPDVTFIYDEHSRLIQRNDGIGTTRFTYDANDNLLTVDGPWADDTITYAYDALDRRTDMDARGGRPVAYGYDGLGRLASVTHGTRASTLTYQGNSNLIDRLTRPNGSYTTYTNDALQRLTALGNYKSDGSVINRFEYSYDTDDQRTEEIVTNGLPMVALSPGLEEMQVNELNQVASAGNPARTYHYDADGNMTQGYTPDGYVWTAIYDAENRLTSITFTDAGGIVHYTRYEYLGNDLVGLVRRSQNGVLQEEMRIVRDGLLLILERNGENAVQREYIWRGDGLGGIGQLLRLTQEGGDYEYLMDGRGNVVGSLGDAEQQVAAYRYGSYGNLVAEASTINQPMGFSSKSFDAPNGLSDFGYRFYSPSLGKWLTRDPAHQQGGVNLYGYAHANPEGFVDPDGQTPLVTGAIGAGIGAIIGGYNAWSSGGSWSQVALGAGQGAVVGGVSGLTLGFGGAAISGLVGGGIAGGALAGAVAGAAGNAAGQGFGMAMEMQCGFDWEQFGFATAAGGLMGGAFLRPYTAPSQPVTSWAGRGVNPDLNPGRWVMTGGRTLGNYGRTVGPAIRGYPYSNSISSTLPRGSLSYPQGATGNLSGLLGQRIIVP